MKLFSKKIKPIIVPIQIEQPDEWTELDERTLFNFLESITGNKLKKLCYYDLHLRSLSGSEKTPFEHGVDAGKNRFLCWLLSLAQLSENDE